MLVFEGEEHCQMNEELCQGEAILYESKLRRTSYHFSNIFWCVTLSMYLEVSFNVELVDKPV